MYLKRIEMSGFKSFADPMSIEFKDGITCIIGPNGSGKSNISDAMRWVLGEQSAKTLRGGKMEEIIFAGSENRRSKGMAEVTIVFDNTTNILPIDFSEVSIKRRLYRSGDSEYYINNSQCRLKDIKELITDTGIGVDGYSFIGQGRVDKMVSEKPETRREVFEEAAGIVKYKTKKEQAQRKLDSAQINLDRMNDIIDDIESRIGGLKEESEKAKEHAGLMERHKVLEIGITIDQIEKIIKKNEELAHQAADVQHSLEQIKSEKEELEKKISDDRTQIETLSESISGLEKAISDNALRTSEINSELRLSGERQKHLQDDLDRLTMEKETQIKIQSRYEEQLQDLHEKRVTYQEEVAGYARKLEDKSGQDENLKQEAQEKQAHLDDLKNNLFNISSEMNLKRSELDRNMELLGSFDTTVFHLKDEIEETENALGKARSEHRNAKARIEDVSDNRDALAKSLEGMYSDRAQIDEDIRALTAEDKNQGLRAEQLRGRLRAITEMEANYEGFNSGVKAVMRQHMDGIIGVVSDLFTLPKGFEVAIETALGAGMQNIVTADDEAAKRAIRFLKENHAGRLTFLPVSSIKPPYVKDARALEESAGFLGFATDIITFDETYNNIFSFLLGRTIIVDNIDNATRMSKLNTGGFRLVTKDGDVVNPGGSLTGGRYKNKSANLLERRSEKQSLSDEIAAFARESESRQNRLTSLSEKLTEINVSLSESDNQIRVFDTDLAHMKAELSNYDYKKTQIEARITKLQADLARVDDEKDASLNLNDQLIDDIDDLKEAKIQNDRLIDALISEMEDARDALDTGNKELTELRVRLSETEAELRALDNSIRDIQLRHQTSVNNAIEIERKKQELLHPQDGSLDVDTLEQTLTRLDQEKTALETKLEDLKTELTTIKTKVGEDTYSISAKTSKIDSLRDQHMSMEIELGRQDTRKDTLKEKLWDEFEMSYAHALDLKDPEFTVTAATKENREIKERLRELGDVNPLSIAEYKEVAERYEFLSEQRDDITQSIDDYKKIVVDMDRISKKQFRETFDAVSENFRETFSKLFGGGIGEIRLEDVDDPLETGIEINVRPPGKPGLASIEGYSGGERTMVAIALMFAILKAKPTPFCILDEIDAALDEANIHRFADYLVNFKEVQFSLVTHQRATMEYADALFGVTMQEKGVTKILSLLLGNPETETFALEL
ncbi:MAG: chromosome segregation protein SMC [Clostridiales Family XIII bacterium]|jgi:chromosome segregation protein|nr:chromosome segregation protein SMC [Clostridiales Family XIII bacterium]